ncbi:hypothetical protein HC749_06185 [Arthrobacter sp. S13_S34]|nr:hypothetical protein [Arthrobacter sp. S13_S34]
MDVETGPREQWAPQVNRSLKRRGLLRLGTLVAALTGASAVSGGAADSAHADIIDPTLVGAFVPLAEKGSSLGVATLDEDGKIPLAQLPYLSGTLAPISEGEFPHWRTSPELARATARITLQDTATPDGTGEIVHPSVVYIPKGLSGYTYWLAATPYANDDSALENPCLWASNDGASWVVPMGLTNPIEPKPAPVGGYNSDTQILYQNGKLVCFWRAVEGNGTTGEKIYFRSSTDGINWGPKTATGITSDPTRRSFVSPAVDVVEGQWFMYVVDGKATPRTLYRMSAAGPEGPWSAPEVVTITGSTESPWHIDVHRVGDEWHMLAQGGGPSGGDLFAAVSGDGLSFTAAPHALIPRFSGTDNCYYKSCFIPAVVDGKIGWDAWLTGFGRPHKIGRTRVVFDRDVFDQATANRRVADIVAAQAALFPWLVGDAFSRADAASVGTAPSGQTWTSGHTISSKAAQGGGSSTIETGVADHWATVDFVGTSGEHWILVRYRDGGNRFRIGTDGGFGLKVQKIIGGSIVPIPNNATSPAGKRLGVRCTGSLFQIYVDGIEVYNFKDTDFQTATKVGFQGSGTASRFRNLTVRAS